MMLQLITVRDAFAGLTDDPTQRVVLRPDAATARQMAMVPAGDTCRRHRSHHRLTWNRPAPTIQKGGYWSGGAGAYHIWHPAEHRPITIAECKRLGSFPDDFRFAGKVNDVFAQVGNSVPPMFMSCIASHVWFLLGRPKTL